MAKRPALYRVVMRIGARVLNLMGGSRKLISSLPFAGGWTDNRDMPAPSGKTFRELYQKRNRT